MVDAHGRTRRELHIVGLMMTKVTALLYECHRRKGKSPASLASENQVAFAMHALDPAGKGISMTRLSKATNLDRSKVVKRALTDLGKAQITEVNGSGYRVRDDYIAQIADNELWFELMECICEAGDQLKRKK